MPGKTVPECVRKLILQKTREKYSQRQISKMLLVPQATISNIISHYRKVGTLSPLRRPGRTPKTSQKSRSFLVRLVRICPKLTSKQLQRDWTDGHKVHHSTVRRILIKHGLNGRKAARKPLLSKFHAKARFDWCRAVKNNSAQDWDKLIFSDESCIQLSGRHIQFVRRPAGAQERYKTKNHSTKTPGGSKKIMIFGAIWSSGLRKIVRVDGNMNSSSYIDILKSHILPLMQDDQVLQQDNAPCHKSNEVKNFMEKFGVAVVPDWPARSPDLNIIENC